MSSDWLAKIPPSRLFEVTLSLKRVRDAAVAATPNPENPRIVKPLTVTPRAHQAAALTCRSNCARTTRASGLSASPEAWAHLR
jgi:hypothetical protein